MIITIVNRQSGEVSDGQNEDNPDGKHRIWYPTAFGPIAFSTRKVLDSWLGPKFAMKHF